MQANKTKPCPRCGGVNGSIMTDELHRAYNAKSSDGTVICVTCRMNEIMSESKNAMEGK